MTNSMFGNRRLMVHLQFLRTLGMNHSDVELRSYCTQRRNWGVFGGEQVEGAFENNQEELIWKALDMICKITEEDPDESTDKEKNDVEKAGDNEKRGQYTKFWNEFGKSIKLGIIEDAANRNRMKLDGKLTSLGSVHLNIEKGAKGYLLHYQNQQRTIGEISSSRGLRRKSFKVL